MQLQPDRTSTNAPWVRVSPVNDQRAVADHANTVALRQDLELVPVVLHKDSWLIAIPSANEDREQIQWHTWWPTSLAMPGSGKIILRPYRSNIPQFEGNITWDIHNAATDVCV